VTPWQRLVGLPGVVLLDLVRYRRALARSGPGHCSENDGWISVCNRIERLVPEPGQRGVRCDWLWGSTLHAPLVLPSLARQLMRAALSEWPIAFADEPPRALGAPKVSFIFAHSGADRLPQLHLTIRSIFAQHVVPVEVIVVDESPRPLIAQMPEGIVYRHLAKHEFLQPWHKTRAYNVGATLARSDILVFHDGDICVPRRYAEEVVHAIEDRGFAAASLQRFLFYLDPSGARQVDLMEAFDDSLTPEEVVQNWKGGTIAIRRDAFDAIGGFDEAFVGWGGEDAEFYDRCGEVGHCRLGYLPFVHLWHPPQPSKSGVEREMNVEFFRRKMEIPRSQRIGALRQIP